MAGQLSHFRDPKLAPDVPERSRTLLDKSVIVGIAHVEKPSQAKHCPVLRSFSFESAIDFMNC